MQVHPLEARRFDDKCVFDKRCNIRINGAKFYIFPRFKNPQHHHHLHRKNAIAIFLRIAFLLFVPLLCFPPPSFFPPPYILVFPHRKIDDLPRKFAGGMSKAFAFRMPSNCNSCNSLFCLTFFLSRDLDPYLHRYPYLSPQTNNED